MRYINTKNPNLRMIVKRGPELPKGENQNTRQDKAIEFRFGLAESDDPETIAFLDGTHGQAAGAVREEDASKVKGYVKEADMEATIGAEVERRLAELTRAIPKLEGGPFVCPDCGKGLSSQIGLAGHRRTHKKEKNKRREAVAVA